MAYEIPADVVIPAGRLLIQADEGADACVGTIIKIGIEENFGCFSRAFRLTLQDDTKIRRNMPDPEYVPPEPEGPYIPIPTIPIDYTRVVFNRLTAQEVKIGETDYVLIHINEILGLIPSE